jgi:hypothetical protein
MLLVAVSLGGCFATVGPDGRVVDGGAAFTLVLPAVLPPMVVVQPGVSVVTDLDHEVFYADGSYWARQDRSWYRSHDHRQGWVLVEDRYVPAPIARSQPGQYRRYRGGEHPQRDRGDDRNRGDRD